MKADGKYIQGVFDTGGEGVPHKELRALSQALRDRDMGFISLTTIMRRGVSILMPKVVEENLMKHKEVCQGVIHALRHQADLLEQGLAGVPIEDQSDGHVSDMSDPIGTLTPTSDEPVN